MRHRRLIAAAVVAAGFVLEAWLFLGRRSGEPSYEPPAAVVVPSLETAGAEAITQTFVPGADGLTAISFVPLLGAVRPRTPVDLRLEVEGGDVPMAERRLRLPEGHVPPELSAEVVLRPARELRVLIEPREQTAAAADPPPALAKEAARASAAPL